MKSMISKLSGTIAAAVVVTALGAAQTSPEKPATAAPPGAAKVALPLPFQPGETLVYEVSFSKLIFSGVVGDIKISVLKQAGPESASIEFKAEAVSRGFFPTLLGFKVKDTYSSTVNAADLGLHSFKRTIQEGKTRREQASTINREAGRVTFTARNLADTKAQPRVKEAPSPAWVQDLLSAIYYVRTQKLNEGDVIAIPISDGGDLYNIEVLVGKREELKLALGKFKTIKLEAKVFDGRFIKRSGEMLVWLSDNPNRLITRVRIKTSGATVTAELKRIG
ncbi:MAG: DUF3108 domain-containing protein [Acidobacteriota bacterium]